MKHSSLFFLLLFLIFLCCCSNKWEKIAKTVDGAKEWDEAAERSKDGKYDPNTGYIYRAEPIKPSCGPGEKAIKVPCENCDGDGYLEDHNCPRCDGEGSILVKVIRYKPNPPYYPIPYECLELVKCPECRGSGYLVCKFCNIHGWVWKCLSDHYPNITKQEKFPKFPWPPPKASATAIIKNDFLMDSTEKILRLEDIKNKLCNTLDSCGYFDKSFFTIKGVPAGFALVTRLEQIYPDGRPKENPERWATEVNLLNDFRLKLYLKALFTANPGYYRIIVFIISPEPFSQADTSVKRDEAIKWLSDGMNDLPMLTSLNIYSHQHKCTALIYEFIKPDSSEEPKVLIPGRIPGLVHLQKSKILKVRKE